MYDDAFFRPLFVDNARQTHQHKFDMKMLTSNIAYSIRHLCSAIFVAWFLGGCALSPLDRGAFDLESGSPTQVDSKGFPVIAAGEYKRNVPLKRTIARAELEAELQAQAEAEASSRVKVDERRNELLQQRLRQIARTHGAQAEAEIAASCKTDADGVVTCK